MIWNELTQFQKDELFNTYNQIKYEIKKLNSDKANKSKKHIFTQQEEDDYNNNITKLQNKYNTICVDYKCDMCGKIVHLNLDKMKQLFKNIHKPIFCSVQCSGKYYAMKSHKKSEQEKEQINKKISQTLLEYNSTLSEQERKDKYGKNATEYWSKIPSDEKSDILKSRSKKAKQTKLEKYGSETYNNRDKAKQTNDQKYGVDNILKLQSNRDKAKQTILDRYGVEFFFSNRDIFKQISIQKYHTYHPMQNEKVKLKLKQAKLEKYGDENYNNRPKMKETCMKKYGKPCPFNTQKSKYTKLARYNDANYNNREKAMKTLYDRYGKDYYENQIKYTGSRISKINKKFAEFANITDFEFPINSSSYDLKYNNFLIEIDPTFTHNCLPDKIYNKFGGLDKEYHYKKSKLALENSYRCIHVFDWDDWNKIKYMIQDKQSLYARKLTIQEVPKNDCDDFLNHYHIQNTCKGQDIRLGLYDDDNLIQLMTFGKPRYNKKYQYELLRLCTLSDYKVIGGAERLFKYFLATYNPTSIVSYCDFSKFSGSVYTRLGFTQLPSISFNKHWVKGNKHITDNLLRQRGYDQLFKTNFGKGTSNEQLMLENNWLPIYDAGQLTFYWKAK